MIDYNADFTTYEILEALITWAQEVGKIQGFVIIINKFDINRHGRNGNGRVLLSCDREGTYRNRNAKKNQSSKLSRSICSKKMWLHIPTEGQEFVPQ